jgi:hypothetical protein
MKKKKTLWRFWAKALGEKASKNDRESDHIAGIRTVIFSTYLLTNLFIIAGVIRHWNDNEIPSCILQIQEEQNQQTNRSFL